jgi:hypothetical protein
MVRNVSQLIIPSTNNRSKSAVAAREDANPYRWLEDSASPETAAWVTAQNERTQAYLASVPTREVIRSDWLTWHVRDVAADADLGDALGWCRCERAGWDSGSSGYYYAAMTPPRPRRGVPGRGHGGADLLPPGPAVNAGS